MVLWIIATFCAYFVKGLSGFANTLVFTSIIGFREDNIKISPVDLLLSYPSNALMAFKGRNNLDKKIWVPLSVMVLLGSIPGIFFLKNADTTIIKIFCGLLIAIVGVVMFFQEMGIGAKKSSKIGTFLIGIISGICCGLYGIGALMAVYITQTAKDSEGFKANICMIFFLENTLRIVVYASWGIITFASLKLALLLIPVMVVGLETGIFVGKRMEEKKVKMIVIILLIISGLVLAGKTVMPLL